MPVVSIFDRKTTSRHDHSLENMTQFGKPRWKILWRQNGFTGSSFQRMAGVKQWLSASIPCAHSFETNASKSFTITSYTPSHRFLYIFITRFRTEVQSSYRSSWGPLVLLFTCTHGSFGCAPDFLHSVLPFFTLFSGGLFLLIETMSGQSVFGLILLCVV